MFVIVTLVARLKHDGLLTVRTDGDDADARLQLVLKELDVILEGLWELIRRCELRHIRLPSRQFLVDGLHIVNLIREIPRDGTIGQLICHTSFDGVKTIKHIALHHDQLCNAVNHDAVTQLHEVNPPAATLTACHSTILMTEITDGLSHLIEELCGERTGTTRVQ